MSYLYVLCSYTCILIYFYFAMTNDKQQRATRNVKRIRETAPHVQKKGTGLFVRK